MAMDMGIGHICRGRHTHIHTHGRSIRLVNKMVNNRDVKEIALRVYGTCVSAYKSTELLMNLPLRSVTEEATSRLIYN